MSNRTVGVESESEHRVTPLELFFDLVFVFAITQVTSLLADDPTWAGVLRGMLVLAAIWWTWTGYAWLTSAIDVDEGGVRLAVLGAVIAMLGVALAVPDSFGDDALLFGVALLLVRLLHVVLAFGASRDDPASRSAIARTARTAILARTRLMQATGLDRARLARDAYNYLHLLMIAGVVLFALGLKTTLRHVGDALDTVPAVALCGGVALYLSAHIGFLWRSTGRIFRRRSIATLVLLALIPAAVEIPALASLVLVAATCSLVVAYEALRYRESRTRIRHPELPA